MRTSPGERNDWPATAYELGRFYFLAIRVVLDEAPRLVEADLVLSLRFQSSGHHNQSDYDHQK